MNKLNILNTILSELNVSIKDVSYNYNFSFIWNLESNIKKYILCNIENFDLDIQDIEGESKKVYKDPNSDICLIRLKPTLYSYTFNRYDVVAGTDDLRYKFWDIFAKYINNITFNYLYNGNINCNNKVFELLDKINFDHNYPFLNSYLGSIFIDNKTYAICKYVENQTPLEVVWKQRFVGTMKHTLLDVDKYRTKFGKPIDYEGFMPEIIRFDWRNPCWRDEKRYKDECIPDDFAAFYTDINNAKNTCKAISNIIDEMLHKAGYKFIDTCYFINSSGNIIYSEITPDGMRIQKINDNDSRFDKDLWRQGKDKDTILRVWSELLNDLTKVVHYEK